MLRLFLFIIVVLLLTYVGGWYGISKVIEERIAKVFVPVGAASEEKFVEISGFPMGFTFSLKQGLYNIVPLAEKVVVEKDEDVLTDSATDDKPEDVAAVVEKIEPVLVELGSNGTMRMDFWDNDLIFQLPNYIYWKDDLHNDEMMVSYPQADGVIGLTFKSKNIFTLYEIFSAKDTLASSFNLTNLINRVSYSDTGIVLFNALEAKQENVLFSSQKNLFSISVKDIEEYYKSVRLYYSYENAKMNDAYYVRTKKRFATKYNEEEMRVLDWVIAENRKSGSSSAEFDITYTGFVDPLVALARKNFKVDVSRFAYSDHQFSVSLEGNLSSDGDDAGVYGWTLFEVGNYARLIDFLSRFYNTVAVPSLRKPMLEVAKVFLPKLKVEHIEMIKRIVPQLGRVSSDEKDIIISAIKNKGDRYMRVGKTNWLKLRRLIKKEIERTSQSNQIGYYGY